MTEIEQKAVEEMADRIGKFYNYQITQSDTYELAKFLYIAGYRKQGDTVKEFAEKLKDGLDRKCRDHGATNMRILQTQGNLLYKAYQLIEDLAEQYGKEE